MGFADSQSRWAYRLPGWMQPKRTLAMVITSTVIAFILGIVALLGSSVPGRAATGVYMFRLEPKTLDSKWIETDGRLKGSSATQKAGLYDTYTFGILGACGHDDGKQIYCFQDVPSPFSMSWDDIVDLAKDQAGAEVKVTDKVHKKNDQIKRSQRALYVITVLGVAALGCSMLASPFTIRSRVVGYIALVLGIASAVLVVIAFILGLRMYVSYRSAFKDQDYMKTTVSAGGPVLLVLSMAFSLIAVTLESAILDNQMGRRMQPAQPVYDQPMQEYPPPPMNYNNQYPQDNYNQHHQQQQQPLYQGDGAAYYYNKN